MRFSRRIISMDGEPLNLVRPEVPVEVAALVAKMMAKEPDRRFQTPADVAVALVPFFKFPGSGTQISSRIATRCERPTEEPSQNAYIIDPTAEPATPSTVPATAVDTTAKDGRDEVNWESLVQVEQDTLIAEPEKPKPRCRNGERVRAMGQAPTVGGGARRWLAVAHRARSHCLREPGWRPGTKGNAPNTL